MSERFVATAEPPPTDADHEAHDLRARRFGAGSAVATASVVIIWTLLLISVQPWALPLASGQPAPSNIGKGVLVGICLLIAIVAARGPLRARTPTLWWFYIAYASVAVVSTLIIGDISGIASRVVRLLIALIVVLCLWPNLTARHTRLLTAMFVAYLVLAVSTVLGPIYSPSTSWENGLPYSSGGRMIGPIIPMLPTRVGELGAIVAGLGVVYWAFRRMNGWWASVVIAVGVALLVLSRTRTATAAVLAGLVLVAIATWQSEGGRRLRASLIGFVLALVPLSPFIIAWILRGQSKAQLSELSGRTVAWSYILHLHVDTITLLFGHGLGHSEVFIRRADNTLNYAPIDSSWITLYYESGLIGLGIILAGFVTTVIMSFRCRTPFIRACCILIMSYVSVDGFSETGLSDVSSLFLLMLVAGMSSYLDRPVKTAVAVG